MNSPLDILHEDHHLLVVSKPAPLLTQAPAEVPSLESLVKGYIKEKYSKPAGVYLGVPHRLDRPVTGVVLFARNTKAAQRVHEQFQNRTVKKIYWAFVDGEPPEGLWEDAILKIAEESRVVRAEPNTPGAKLSSLRCTILKRTAHGTLLELAPHTGRMHQLRAQCAWRGAPVHGDRQYGSSLDFAPVAEEGERGRRIALHARSLTIRHPFQNREEMTFTAPLPESWKSLGLEPWPG